MSAPSRIRPSLSSEKWEVDEGLVLDASPLISLGAIGRLDLVEALAPDVAVPTAVADEVLKGADEASRALLSHSFRTVPVDPNGRVVAWGLGPGETAVLSFCLSRPGHRAVVDDLAARRCASALGILTRGTIGLLLLARIRGLIPSLSSDLESLRRAGFYVSEELRRHALRVVNEEPSD
jgi:predicted nucleic acid-binding protein